MKKEELNINKKELIEVKEELKNVKEEMMNRKEKETVENPKADEFSCKSCDLNLCSKKKLKMHNQSKHTLWIKCGSCEETLENNCDLEADVKRSHDSFETFECDNCGKTFVLKCT